MLHNLNVHHVRIQFKENAATLGRKYFSCHFYEATHGMWSPAGLKMPIFVPLLGGGLTSKVGQTDLVFGL